MSPSPRLRIISRDESVSTGFDSRIHEVLLRTRPVLRTRPAAAHQPGAATCGGWCGGWCGDGGWCVSSAARACAHLDPRSLPTFKMRTIDANGDLSRNGICCSAVDPDAWRACCAVACAPDAYQPTWSSKRNFSASNKSMAQWNPGGPCCLGLS
jgi:hypothetical protein